MTVTSVATPRKKYDGNDLTVNFPITFPYESTSDVVVLHTDASGVETTWTLDGAGDTGYTVSSGSVVANTAPASSTTLLLYRETPLTQLVDLRQNRRFNAETEEDSFDKLALAVQDNNEKLGRTAMLPINSDYADLFLPEPLAGYYLKWNSALTGLENALMGTAALNLPVLQLSDYVDLAAAITAIGATDTELWIDQDDTSNATVPSNVTLRFINKNTLAGNVNIYSPENIIAGKSQQIFSGAGSIAFTDDGGEVQIGWYGAVGDDPGDGTGTDDSAAILKAITSARNAFNATTGLGPSLVGIPGRTYLSEEILFVGRNAGTASKWVYKLKDLSIYGLHTDFAIIDYTGAHGKVLQDVHVRGDATTTPDCGLYLGRKDSSTSAGITYFKGKCSIKGTYDLFGLINYASEEYRGTDLDVSVTAGIGAALFTDDGYYWNGAAFVQLSPTNQDSDPGQISNTNLYNTRGRFVHTTAATDANYVSHVQLLGTKAWKSLHNYFGSASVGDDDSIYIMMRNSNAGSSNESFSFINSQCHSTHKIGIEMNGNVVNPYIPTGNRWGTIDAAVLAAGTGANIFAGSASTKLYDAEIACESFDFGAVTCDVLGTSVLTIGETGSGGGGKLTVSDDFDGEARLRTGVTFTLGDEANTKAKFYDSDTGTQYYGHRNLDHTAYQTAPGTGNITLAAADLIGGIIEEDPEGAANWTLDTATNIIAALPYAKAGDTFTCIVYNGATDGSAEAVTLKTGAGITMQGPLDEGADVVLTEGVNNFATLTFRINNTGTPAITVWVMTNL